jgi:hypothetical protein
VTFGLGSLKTQGLGNSQDSGFADVLVAIPIGLVTLSYVVAPLLPRVPVGQRSTCRLAALLHVVAVVEGFTVFDCVTTYRDDALGAF